MKIPYPQLYQFMNYHITKLFMLNIIYYDCRFALTVKTVFRIENEIL